MQTKTARKINAHLTHICLNWCYSLCGARKVMGFVTWKFVFILVFGIRTLVTLWAVCWKGFSIFDVKSRLDVFQHHQHVSICSSYQIIRRKVPWERNCVTRLVAIRASSCRKDQGLWLYQYWYTFIFWFDLPQRFQCQSVLRIIWWTSFQWNPVLKDVLLMQMSWNICTVTSLTWHRSGYRSTAD